MNTKTIFIIAIIICGCLCGKAQNNYKLTATERGEIEQDVKNKVDDFISYLPEIAAKSGKGTAAAKTAKRYIAQALKLFIGQGEDYTYIDANGNIRPHSAVTMQTTSRKKKNPPKEMKRYLNNLMALPYHKVEVDTCQAVRLTGDIHSIGNNRWTCTAYFIQTFRAVNSEGQLVVNDKDPKKVTIYVDCDEILDPATGKVEKLFTVQLGDICIYSDYQYLDW